MQRIRTEAEIPFEVALLEVEEPLLYQVIAEKASHLQQLGMNIHTISKHLKVDDRTVKKALRWLANG